MQIKDKELVDLVEKKLDGTNDSVYDMQNYLNLAYYAGKQWVTYDEETKRLYEPTKESYKVRLVANKIQPIVRTELAKILRNKPIMIAVPATSEQADENSSRIVEKFLEYIEYSLDLQDKDKEAVLWGLNTGNGWIKCFWNPDKGDILRDPENGETIKNGDVDIDILSPFEIRYDQTAKKFDEIAWICQRKVRTVSYVKSVYGKKVEPESGIMNTNLYESKLRNLNNSFSTTNYKSAEDSVEVKEYWEKPSSKYKNGRRITIANGEVLFYDEDIGFGNEERILPFFHFTHIQIPGRVEGMSIIEQLIPVQREYNKTRSQLIEYKNLMAFPQWLVENGSLNSDITDEPGAIIEYKNGRTPPRTISVPTISSDVYKNIELCDQEFFFISGQQETSHGGAPAGIKSGVAIRYLQEQDDTKIMPTISNWVNVKRKYMTYLVKLAKHYYTIPRKIKVVGKDKKVQVLEFQGSDITTTDIRIEEGSLFQQSKSAKQQYVFDMLGAGVLNPVEDRALILKMLELGVVDDMYDDEQIDSQQAQNEEVKWSRGLIDTITRDFFNHAEHIKVHNKFRKQNEYVELEDSIKAYIDEHVLEHEMLLQQQVAQNIPQAVPETTQNTIPTIPEVSLEDIISRLSDDEKQAIYDNPALLDQFMK